MADKSYKIINSSVLIEEIKKHPVLYDLKLGNGNPELKKQSWEEVAMALFEERWAKFNLQEKDALVREIQVKWKSLRDNFTRVLRKEKEDEQAGIPPGKKKKYLYYDQLMFLMPFTSFRKTNSHVNSKNNKDASIILSKGDNKSITRSIPNIIYLDESKDSNESIQFNITKEENPLQTTTQPTTISSVQPLQFIQIQPSSSLPNITTVQSSNQGGEEDDNNTNTTKRIAAVLEEVVALHKEEKSDDPMGNRKFLLSLLPFMRKLPDDVNLEVRLQLMSVLQSYNSGKSFL